MPPPPIIPRVATEVEEASTNEGDEEATTPLASSVPIEVAPISTLPPAAATCSSDKKPADCGGEARRMVQRLWTDEDEIAILQGFYEFTSRCGTTQQHDTGPFYETIRSRLQLDFTKSQLVEKLRRFKKKYRNVVAKGGGGGSSSFRSPHDYATFDLSQKIWGGSLNGHEDYAGKGRKRRRGRKRTPADVGVDVEGGEALTKLVLAMPATGAWKEVGSGDGSPTPCRSPGRSNWKAGVEERWRKQQIRELEVYSRRLELVQEQIKAELTQLRAGR